MARSHGLILAALALAACTNGGTAVPSSGAAAGGSARIVDVDLTKYASQAIPQGLAGGFAPLVTTVAVGTTIRFTNSDAFAHTATFIGQGGTFPAASPFGGSALTQSGTALSQGWSSGSLAPGAASQTILIDAPGTYLFGCFYHYGAPMRGVIVAQ